MRVLIVGQGGREHALAWKIAQSPLVSEIFVAPGNPGTLSEYKCKNIPIHATDCLALLDFAKTHKIDLTLIGPEAPLALGLSDLFMAEGLPCFAPSAQAAQLETSKAYCKDFLKKYHIPTAAFSIFDQYETALAAVQNAEFPLVIKADGLAGGKGVIIAKTLAEAEQALFDCFQAKQFGEAGNRVIIETFLNGREASFIVMVDGQDILPFATSEDHKARFEGDRGPNTGGMGAFSPASNFSNHLNETVLETIIRPTLRGLQQEGIFYRGFLYAGLMIQSDNQPMLLEYNCRLGDPETQPLLMRLQSDLAALCLAGTQGKLGAMKAAWSKDTALGVVLVDKSYPTGMIKNQLIQNLPTKRSTHQKIFHAGTKISEQGLMTSGGRVFCATAMGTDLKASRALAYTLAEQPTWPEKDYRKDIGARDEILLLKQ